MGPDPSLVVLVVLAMLVVLVNQSSSGPERTDEL